MTSSTTDETRERFHEDVRLAVVDVVRRDLRLEDTAAEALAVAGSAGYRSQILLEAASAGSCFVSYGSLVRAGAAVETLHLGTLLHDDYVDGAVMRRGRHTASGERALLYGLMCVQFAIQSIGTFDGSRARLVTRSLGELAEGQLNDVERAASSLAEIDYIRMHERKTGTLFALCAELGYSLGDGSTSRGHALARRAGAHFGTCFQIIDDLKELAGEDALKSRRDESNGNGLYTTRGADATWADVVSVARRQLFEGRVQWELCLGVQPDEGSVWTSLAHAIDRLELAGTVPSRAV